MIAYCLYKEQKKKYVENLARRYRKISRRSRRVEDFHKDLLNPEQIANFRDAADYRLAAYVKTVSDEAKNEAYREMAFDRERPPHDNGRRDKSKTMSNWIFGVSTSIAATIILGVFVDLDEIFPSIDPFPDEAAEPGVRLMDVPADPFAVEPAAAPLPSNRPVM